MRDDSPNPDTSNLANPIARGTLCLVDGERVAAVYLDIRIGQSWGGKYRVQSCDGTRGIRDVARERLQPLTLEERGAYHLAHRAAV